MIILLLVSCSGQEDDGGNTADNDSSGDTGGYSGGPASIVMPELIPISMGPVEGTMSIRLGSSPLITYASGTGTSIYSSITSTNLLSVAMHHTEIACQDSASAVNIKIYEAIGPQFYTVDDQTLLTLTYCKSGNSIIYSATSGTITISSVGEAGEPITGSFDVILTCITNCAGTTSASGTFFATRVLVATPSAPVTVDPMPGAGS